MKKANKLILPLALVGTGIALYFLNKSGKLDKLKNLIQGTTTPEITAPTALTIGPGTTTTTANPLGNAAAVKKFQKYYNSVRPIPFANLIEDGIFGPLTAAAYNSYKDKYKKFLETPPNEIPNYAEIFTNM